MSTLTAFERRVLNACLAGDDPRLELLRLQADVVSVASREHTGVGAYVNFVVPDTSPKLDPGTIVISDVNLEVSDVPEGVATLLYVYEGTLQFIEFATYNGEWPKNPEIVSMTYLQEIRRAGEAFGLVPVEGRHLETLARALRGRESQSAT